MNYFAYPWMWIWIAVPAMLLGLVYYARRRRAVALERLGQPRTVQRLIPITTAKRRRWATACTVSGLVLWVIALSGPLFGSRLVEFKQRGLDIFIAVDCSLSMQAEDFRPNRMAHAKLLLSQLIDRLAGHRLGIIAFAGQAYVECPLTIDTNAAKQILETIDTNAVPIPGTVIGEAIRTAIKGLQAGEGGSRVLILLTDGEDHRSDPIAAAKQAAKVGMKIFTIGIGTADGVPIPVMDAAGHRVGYKQDKKGNPVLSRLDGNTLIEISRETGGRFLPATATGDEVEKLLHELESLNQGELKSRRFNRYENRYQWPLAAGLLLLLIGLAIPEDQWKRA